MMTEHTIGLPRVIDYCLSGYDAIDSGRYYKEREQVGYLGDTKNLMAGQQELKLKTKKVIQRTKR